MVTQTHRFFAAHFIQDFYITGSENTYMFHRTWSALPTQK
jgi:hypothetical protein